MSPGRRGPPGISQRRADLPRILEDPQCAAAMDPGRFCRQTLRRDSVPCRIAGLPPGPRDNAQLRLCRRRLGGCWPPVSAAPAENHTSHPPGILKSAVGGALRRLRCPRPCRRWQPPRSSPEFWLQPPVCGQKTGWAAARAPAEFAAILADRTNQMDKLTQPKSATRPGRACLGRRRPASSCVSAGFNFRAWLKRQTAKLCPWRMPAVSPADPQAHLFHGRRRRISRPQGKPGLSSRIIQKD